jgi:hypothetical protein
MIHRVKCINCKKSYPIELDVNQYVKWQEGMLIQDVFPQMSADDRELLISRTCGSCWEIVIPKDDKCSIFG